MRTIKFRGKRVDNGEWVYGYYWASIDPTKVETEYRAHFISEGVSIKPFTEVVKETVGQYTGLDENAYGDGSLNKPIYEGDKVRFIDGEILEVEWNDDTCVFQFSDGSPLNDMERYATHKEVIGNIHDK